MRPPDATPFLRLYAKRRLAQLDRECAVERQRATLLGLVSAARDTKFGVEHGFATIDSVAAYQAQTPLRSYEDFWSDYWAPSFPRLIDVTWPGQIPFFAVSSGTTKGTTKSIPCSRAMISANRRAALDVLCHHIRARPRSKILSGRTFMLGGSTALTCLAPGVFSGDLSGIAAKTVPLWARPYAFPPENLSLLADWDKKIESLAERALNEPIRALSGTPSWLIILIERMGELKRVRGQSGPVFPELDLLVHGGVAFAPYRARFEQYLQGTAAETREVYPASEGFVAIADREPDAGLRLIADNGIFFEFVPVDELSRERPTRHWAETIETATNYAVVVSTNAGLWSYLLGDTVRFVETRPPRLVVTGRISYMLSAFGEHIIEEEIEAAVTEAAVSVGVNVTDFSVGARYPDADNHRGVHRYFIECETAPPSPDLWATWAVHFSAVIDRVLQERNDDYRAHRQGDAQMAPPEIRILPPGSFAQWMRARGRLGGQNKVPRILSDPEAFGALDEWMAANAVQRCTTRP